ncbi:hypothetical protein BK742_26135 [Bacillus thuringiensis serovar pingluonsis]|uniref:Uncharacterized protein n=1 Tax=Bacillus thuringiensis serovar pingluonsis TaxID=180881 RepID=A0A243AYN6_BACTU|nr:MULTISPECIES: hypothetical protein [Bacillus cereus group]MEB9684589.1 hypothetical protein [Bacillus anthracis]OTY35440.1 hypothetical protein BK742_26135 [Bacillus thuringiensis serovar pingluonsis]
MKTYNELVEKCKELINRGWTHEAIYGAFDSYSPFDPETIKKAIDEALNESSLSDNVLDYRPNLENLKAMEKDDDYVFQALAYMGNASQFMSWANTVLELVEEVPEELKEEIKKVHSGIWGMQERLRAVDIK